jgi:hypothetical protein
MRKINEFNYNDGGETIQIPILGFLSHLKKDALGNGEFRCEAKFLVPLHSYEQLCDKLRWNEVDMQNPPFCLTALFKTGQEIVMKDCVILATLEGKTIPVLSKCNDSQTCIIKTIEMDLMWTAKMHSGEYNIRQRELDIKPQEQTR